LFSLRRKKSRRPPTPYKIAIGASCSRQGSLLGWTDCAEARFRSEYRRRYHCHSNEVANESTSIPEGQASNRWCFADSSRTIVS
jgi:hypothetical protein